LAVAISIWQGQNGISVFAADPQSCSGWGDYRDACPSGTSCNNYVCCPPGYCGWGNGFDFSRACVANGQTMGTHRNKAICRSGDWKTQLYGYGCEREGYECDSGTCHDEGWDFHYCRDFEAVDRGVSQSCADGETCPSGTSCYYTQPGNPTICCPPGYGAYGGGNFAKTCLAAGEIRQNIWAQQKFNGSTFVMHDTGSWGCHVHGVCPAGTSCQFINDEYHCLGSVPMPASYFANDNYISGIYPAGTCKSCLAQGKNCGIVSDRCGGYIYCGECAAGSQSCVDNVCTTAGVCAGDNNVSGWAWSENIGWVSFNCADINASTGGGSPSPELGLVRIDSILGITQQVAMSDNGQYQIVSGDWEYKEGEQKWTFYTSNDYGKTWIRQVDNAGAYLVYGDAAISDDGQFQIVVAGSRGVSYGEMYISTDGGESWSKNASYSNIPWSSVAMSGDGNYLIATSYDGFYVSLDQGLTWSNCMPIGSWSGAALSSNGKYQIVTDEHFLGYRYSSDYSSGTKGGCGFVTGDFILGPIEDYIGDRSVAMSDSGQYITVAMNSSTNNSDYLYVSSNNGVSFEKKGLEIGWDSVAMEDDGKHQIAVGGPSDREWGSREIYDSFDYGNTWTKRSDGAIPSGTRVDVAVSADGSCELYASGRLYKVGCDGAGGGSGAEISNIDYGVDIDEDTGYMSGYAWSENIGWISFNESDIAGCPSGVCKAKMATVPSDGKYAITGWARVLSVKNEPANNGGWEGWIKLDGTYIDSVGDFHEFAWSDMVLGWLSFNSADCDGTRCTAVGSYKVHVDLPPKAKISCGGDCQGGLCDSDPVSEWVMYQPIGCPACQFRVKSTELSSGNIACTNWKLINASTNAVEWQSNVSDLTFPVGVPVGHFRLQLTVSDDNSNSDCTAGSSSTDTHLIWIKREVQAGFMCSFESPYPTEDVPEPDPNWMDCNSSAFKKLAKNQTVYVTDDPAKSIHSTKSEGAGNISSRKWTFTIDGAASSTIGTTASFNAGKTNKIDLKVTDDNLPGQEGFGRQGCMSISANAKSLPKWQEVSPVGMIWNYLVASISKVFATL